MTKARIFGLVLIAAALLAYFAFDLGQYFTLDFLKARQQSFQAYYAEHPARTIAIFFSIYVLVTALSVPGAALMTLAGGALFGLLVGALIISFASTVGATLAFLASRYLLRDWVRQHFRTRFDAIDAGVAKDGAFYLFTLRLVPLFPFFLVNLLMGLTSIGARTYYWVSQLGMLAGTLAFVNAGTQLARIDSLSGILSPAVLASFAVLGILPLAGRKALDTFKARRVYKRWRKPAAFDYNLVVIGAGAAGLVSAYIAAAVKAKVALVEGNKMGGDCLNYGCVPSKTLIRTAGFVQQARHAKALGIGKADPEFDFADVMQRVHKVIARIAPHDSVERYTELGVDVMQGQAKIVSPWEVEVDGKRVSTKAIVIATGAQAVVPDIPGLREAGFYTSDTLWELRELPKLLIVLGGGPIGCELAQAFARLGSSVTQVEKGARLMPREDDDVAQLVSQSMADDGVRILTGAEALRCEQGHFGKRLVVMREGVESALEFDVLLCAVGRVARTTGFGLEELGIPVTPQKTVDTDATLQTLYPNIYACGDVAGPYQFTHTAAHQAWYAAVNALFGSVKSFRADYSVIPWCTFTAPEAARVGLSEQDAREQNIEVEVTRYGIDELDRAITDNVAHGFVKVLTRKGSDKILGAAIVAAHAGDMMAEYVLAMKHGIGLNKVLGTIHIYPTMAEANKYAAGEWKRAHAPQRLLAMAERFHCWRRSA
ncbi:FAD-dependent oxidoreductase [Massilia psychrophila]|uniref:Pyridine nucleotide-disulfide oxidoreductase n=1 Tax=Massilia psychrophila TaxID=1603353 RepID=A0A2G8SWM2_9BURK|nr:bifunctional TVP38/TMEM64 family protein/FAD-dependent oxidoreductase [Massilia psychrophila]PIL38093.1 pyridine nucleotide-disulfide oxidoreductase [Massilia psychrophila]GGE88126.1 pyridine nucleotide-disulfide oxidoreductase [Massilia psychrophila]